jgi:hypothetical protein
MQRKDGQLYATIRSEPTLDELPKDEECMNKKRFS